MSDLVHRVAPSSARARLILAGALLVVSIVGVLATAMAGSTPAIVLAVLFTLTTAGLAVSLGSGLVEQAEAAPTDANPAASEPSTATGAADPITTLQQRYAAGELSDAAFEERMDRLLESGARGDEGPSSDHKREQERAFEQ